MQHTCVMSSSLSFLSLLVWIYCGGFIAYGLIVNRRNKTKTKVVSESDISPAGQQKDKTSSLLWKSMFLLYFTSLIFRLLNISIVPFKPFSGCRGEATVVLTPILICGFSFALRMWAMQSLGIFFSRETVVRSLEKHPVICSGPYAFVRHPGYTASALMFLTCAHVVSGDLVIGLILSVQYLYVLVFYRIPEEESLLLGDATTGDAYKKYTASVSWKLIPYIF
jgi:protein-S-isoprenylcysteine O-methyltransferase Ste14